MSEKTKKFYEKHTLIRVTRTAKTKLASKRTHPKQSYAEIVDTLLAEKK
jgi:hypothetical protein